MSFFGGYQSDFYATSSAQRVNGAVFITDLTPQSSGNVGGKQYKQDGTVLLSAFTDTDFIRVHVLAQTGHSNYRPSVMVAGQPVPLIEDEDKTIWTGHVDIDLNGAGVVTAVHEDGVSHSVTITQEVGPQIGSATFTGGYPGLQTELKAGDTFELVVATDTSMTSIEMLDFGAAAPEVIPLASPGNTATITVTIADRGDTAQAFGAKLRAINANGAKGPVFETTGAGSTDGVHHVVLNNLTPEVVISGIDYPSGQGALKDNETAQVHHLITGFDTVVYASPNTELDIPGATLYAASKSVSRLNGGYNVDTANFRVVATRAANGASSGPVEAIVRIAHAFPSVTIQTPARLRSGGNAGTTAQDHPVTLTSDQLLNLPPAISVPEGVLQGSMVSSGSGLIHTQDLRIHDDDGKGDHTFTLVQATNLAGRVTTSIADGSSYTIGGFVSRTISIPAFSNQVDIGTEVSDVSKVVSRDKDLTTMTYFPAFQDQVQGFTITDSGGQPNPGGDHWRWLDSRAVNNNTTGGATVTLEETI